MNVPATVESARQNTCDYEQENSRLLLHQARLHEKQELIRLRSTTTNEDRVQHDSRTSEVTDARMDSADSDLLFSHPLPPPMAIPMAMPVSDPTSDVSSRRAEVHARPARPRALHIAASQATPIAVTAYTTTNAQPKQQSQTRVVDTNVPPVAAAPIVHKESSSASGSRLSAVDSAARRARMLRADALELGDEFGEELEVPASDDELDTSDQPRGADSHDATRANQTNRAPHVESKRADADDGADVDDDDDALALADAALSAARARNALTSDELGASGVRPDVTRTDSLHPHYTPSPAATRRRLATQPTKSSQLDTPRMNHSSSTDAIEFDHPLPPSTLRLYPPSLIDEVQSAHRTLGAFIQRCTHETRPYKGNPKALVQIYWQNVRNIEGDRMLAIRVCALT